MAAIGDTTAPGRTEQWPPSRQSLAGTSNRGEPANPHELLAGTPRRSKRLDWAAVAVLRDRTPATHRQCRWAARNVRRRAARSFGSPTARDGQLHVATAWSGLRVADRVSGGDSHWLGGRLRGSSGSLWSFPTGGSSPAGARARPRPSSSGRDRRTSQSPSPSSRCGRTGATHRRTNSPACRITFGRGRTLKIVINVGTSTCASGLAVLPGGDSRCATRSPRAGRLRHSPSHHSEIRTRSFAIREAAS